MFRTLKTNLVVVLFALSTLSIASTSRAQQNNDDQQALQDQMRQNMQTVFQNMREKGISPQDIFTPGMDPSEMAQKLIDKGVIDAQFAAQMKTTMEKLATSQLRDQLQCSDAEYDVMLPFIQKVVSAERAMGQMNGMRLMGMPMGTPSPNAADMSKARKALHAAIADSTTTPEQFASILKDLRDARAKLTEELTAARQDLVGVLNTRQEAALASMGLLD